MRFIVIAACLACLAAAPRPAAAGVVPDDVSPPLSFCIGETTHCVLPDLGLRAASYDLSARRWEDAGVSDLGAGYALILWSDQPWAPGVAVHASGRWGRSGSHLDLVPTLVLLRYVHVGATARIGDGGVRFYLTLGAGATLDLLSGRTMRERIVDARVRTMLERVRS
jgi:hypothetical protein